MLKLLKYASYALTFSCALAFLIAVDYHEPVMYRLGFMLAAVTSMALSLFLAGADEEVE